MKRHKTDAEQRAYSRGYAAGRAFVVHGKIHIEYNGVTVIVNSLDDAVYLLSKLTKTKVDTNAALPAV